MEYPLLQSLTEAQRRDVLAMARRRRFGRNEVVFHEGDLADSLHLIAKGRVAVETTTPLGDVVTLAVLGSGAAFGELALVQPDSRRTATIVAVEVAETLMLTRDHFEELRARESSIDRFLVDALAMQVARLSAQVLEAYFVPVETRVAKRLVMLADVYDDNQGTVVIPLKQETIAAMAGTTRPTVNRVLRDLETHEVIALSRGHLTILDRVALAKRAR